MAMAMKNQYTFKNEHVSIVLRRKPNSCRSMTLIFHGADDTTSTFSSKQMGKRERTAMIVHAAGDCFKISARRCCYHMMLATPKRFFNLIKSYVDRYCAFVESATGTKPTLDEVREVLDLDGMAADSANKYRTDLVEALLDLGAHLDLKDLDRIALDKVRRIKKAGLKKRVEAEMVKREIMMEIN